MGCRNLKARYRAKFCRTTQGILLTVIVEEVLCHSVCFALETSFCLKIIFCLRGTEWGNERSHTEISAYEN